MSGAVAAATAKAAAATEASEAVEKRVRRVRGGRVVGMGSSQKSGAVGSGCKRCDRRAA